MSPKKSAHDLSGIVYLKRRESFCASHRLHSDAMGAAENRKLFGKCNSLNGHGHNYEIEVILRGRVNKKTGLLMNLTDLKKILERCVLSKVDHKHLNHDVAELRGVNPTTENLAIYFWKWIAAALPRELLFEVSVFETSKNSATYRGEN